MIVNGFRTEVRGSRDASFARIVVERDWLNLYQSQCCLDSVLGSWPRNTKVFFTVTPGGFISLECDDKFISRRVSSITDNEYKELLSLTVDSVYELLTPAVCRKLATKTEFITVGVDVGTSRAFIRSPHIEAVHVFDVSKRKIVLTTGKSYPIPEQVSTLIPFDDLTTHFKKFKRKSVCIIGCHDLNMFSPRSKASLIKGSRKAKIINEFDRLMKLHKPTILLHHPHTTDTPNIWRTAISGLRKEHPYVKHFVSAGKYANGLGGSVRAALDSVLESTRIGDTLDFVVD